MGRVTCALIGLCSLACAFAAGGEKGSPQDAARKAMEAWREAVRPGEHHRALARLEGDWELTVEYWADPAGPPAVSRGTGSGRLLMEGRYFQEEMQTDLGGEPYSVFMMLGYDNRSRQYWGTWVDNLTTALTTMSGPPDPSGRTIVLDGRYEDPASGAPRRSRGVITPAADGSYMLEVFDTTKREPQRSLRVSHTRRRIVSKSAGQRAPGSPAGE